MTVAYNSIIWTKQTNKIGKRVQKSSLCCILNDYKNKQCVKINKKAYTTFHHTLYRISHIKGILPKIDFTENVTIHKDIE